MRIGLSTSVIDHGHTGIAQYVFSLSRAYARDPGPHQFVLFVLEAELPLFEFARNTLELVPVSEEYRPPVKNILWHQRVLPELTRRYRLDVLHIPSYRRMLAVRPCPLVATIHDLAPFHVPAKYEWKRMLYGRVVARFLAKRQDQIIAISQTTARDIARYFGRVGRKVTVVYNGVDHGRFSPGPRNIARAVMAQRFGLSEPCFLYVARLEHPGKNHVRLISAFNQFKAETHSNWKLLLAGSSWHGAEHIHAAVRQSPYSSDIQCLGFVADEDLPLLYRGAEIVACPSLYEGFGLPVLEAMACGRPVICSNRGALAEVAGTAAAMFDPEQVPELTGQMKRLAGDESLREELGTAGLAQAQRFNWQTTVNKTLEIYTLAASSNPNQKQHRRRTADCSVLRPLRQR
jgi:glycosyltransferase involved in cell wall biosynthesis